MRPIARRRPAAAALTLGVALLVSAASPATGDEAPLTLDDFPALTDGVLTNGLFAVRDYSDSPAFFTVRPYEPGPAVRQVEQVEQEQDQTSVTLASDILFTVDGSDLSEPARAAIGALVAQVPAGATVTVDGHTDSVLDDAHNQGLSERRAQSVAAAVGAARPDVVLDVHGYGESRLKVLEAGEDLADDRAQNRRVELHYVGAPPTAPATPEPTVGAAAAGPYGAAGLVDPVPASGAELLAEQVVDAPGRPGEQLRVGVEGLDVRGASMRLRIVVERLGGSSEPATLYELMDDHSLTPSVADRVQLVDYRTLSNTGQRWSTDTLGLSLVPGVPVRFEATLPAPLYTTEALAVSVDPSWPAFEDVPVTWS
ncbi:OmpA family protein [Cellulomonas sp.]|uniref:OmpA family protein n=1 Tax=Cellulomonas sp. TaxID=40001 RepID=UPI003BAAC847